MGRTILDWRLFFSLSLLIFSFPVNAQNYPNKPIRLVVPFAPGGSSSIVARSIAAEMEKGLGQPIVIDNKPGGGGNVAMLEVDKADPDGYTLIIGHVGSLAMNPFMYDKLPYDVDRDFARSSWCTRACRRRTCANSSRWRRRNRAS
jgi:tripartite-type tricarboxylate transporter receptor subunit TctC